MVNQSSLTSNKGARKSAKRVGRGNGSGMGTFSGRGCKGQKARAGKKIHTLFEGGQSQLHLRLPKLRGFKRTIGQSYVVINLDDLEKLASIGELTRDVLLEKRILSKKEEKLKILGRGSIKATVTIHADAASESAIKAIEKAGGKVVLPEAKKSETKSKKEANKDSE